MKRISLVFAILVSLYASAQHAGNADYNGSYTPNLVPHNQPAGVNLNVTVAGYSYGNMVSLKGDVMMNVLPSSYIIILSATQVSETFEKADSMLNLRFGILKNELRKLGITDQDIHIDFISNVPKYEIEFTEKKHSITGNEVAAGFELKKNVHINVKNIVLMDAIVAASAKAEVYDLVKVDYIVENMEQIYHQLRMKALEIVEMKKAPYAATGIKLKQLDLGETRGSVYPIERYARYTAYNSGTPAFYKQTTPKQTVQVNYAEKNQTVYYEKVPFNQFDHVINPNVEEPCVQFYFSLQVNFKIIDEETEKRQKEDRDFELKRREIELQNLKNPPVADKPRNTVGKK